MATNNKPAIPVLRGTELRSIQDIINAIRERLRTVDNTVAELLTRVNVTQTGSAQAIASLQAQIAALNNALGGVTLILLQAVLLQGPDGFVIRSGNNLFRTRVLEAGDNITIENADGVDGNPLISSSGGGGDVILYDNEGRAAIAADGGAIFLASGA